MASGRRDMTRRKLLGPVFFSIAARVSFGIGSTP